MRAILAISIFCLVASVSLHAQDSSTLTKVSLQDGTTLNAYVEKQINGGYKLTTEDGSVFFFRDGEIQVQSQKILVEDLKYRDLKIMYSTKKYKNEVGDKYSPANIGFSSFFIPGLGQYITGCNVGKGIVHTAIELGSLIGVTSHLDDFFNYVNYYSDDPEGFIYTIAYSAIWATNAILSACSASKAAKIKNLYYRDMRNGVACQFDIAPYFDVIAPTLASEQNFVAGLSLRVSF